MDKQFSKHEYGCCKAGLLEPDSATADFLGPQDRAASLLCAVAVSEQKGLLGPDGTLAEASQPVSGSKLNWTETQRYALVELVSSILELRGGTDENPRLWDDIAARTDLWAPYDVSAQEVQSVFMQVGKECSSPPAVDTKHSAFEQ